MTLHGKVEEFGRLGDAAYKAAKPWAKLAALVATAVTTAVNPGWPVDVFDKLPF